MQVLLWATAGRDTGHRPDETMACPLPVVTVLTGEEAEAVRHSTSPRFWLKIEPDWSPVAQTPSPAALSGGGPGDREGCGTQPAASIQLTGVLERTARPGTWRLLRSLDSPKFLQARRGGWLLSVRGSQDEIPSWHCLASCSPRPQPGQNGHSRERDELFWLSPGSLRLVFISPF